MSQRFNYEIGDKTVSLPLADDIPVGVFAATMLMPATAATVTIIRTVASDDDWAAIEPLPLREFNELVSAWRKASAVTEGES